MPRAAHPLRLALLAGGLLLATPVLAACSENAATDTAQPGTPKVTVAATDDACTLSADTATAGTVSFVVTNGGSKVTEFYLYDADGSIAGEVENIGPQLSRTLTLNLGGGDYQAACKPGMTGDGIRSAFTVTGEASVAPSGDADAIARVEQQYAAWVRQQSDDLLARTTTFVRLYEQGRDREARALYPLARTPWERIETVAESFGDLDPRMDAREADLEPGQRWTGWHRIEKDLWPARAGKYQDLTTAQRTALADRLLADTRDLHGRIADLTFGIDEIANGATGLMEEVATGKVTGEEEYWSRTDLYDFQANLDGAHEAFDLLEPVLSTKDPELEATLAQRFTDLQDLLDQHRRGDGFVSYDELDRGQVRDLAAAVNALAEPLSQLTTAVLA